MTGLTKKSQERDSEGESGFVTPDSTTKEKLLRFVEGEEVLSHGKDGLFYFGVIVSVDDRRERCWVQFEDNTKVLSLFKDIKKLRITESEELCEVCQSSRSSISNEIVLCAICDRGYHQNCVKPYIENEYCQEGSEWECPKCENRSSITKNEMKIHRENFPRKRRLRRSREPSPSIESLNRVLPYNLSSLTWESGHKSNKEQTYCYCAGPGEWYNKMIQCYKCLQWFHEACVDCLHYPLLYGDRFYVFACTICNEGSEFLHRLDLSWLDVVHLAIFNLTITGNTRHFHNENTITPWITDNWEILQCPMELQDVSVVNRIREVNKCLTANRHRFVHAKDSHAKCLLWGLRVRVAPPAPSLSLNHNGPFTHESVEKAIVSFTKNSCSPPVPKTIRTKEYQEKDIRLMPAKKRPSSPYHNGPQNPDECPNRRKRKRELDQLVADPKAKKMIEELHGRLPKKRGRPRKNCLLHKAIRPVKNRLCKDPSISYCTTKDVKIERESSSSILGLGPGTRRDTSGDDSSSRGTLDSFIPPPTNFEGPNNPFSTLQSSKPFNKKLSVRDIKIGKNGEIKRRRYKRKGRKKLMPGPIKNCVDYALNARRKCDDSFAGKISLSELQSNVKSYFGASLANGDNFEILACRLTEDGSKQYLVSHET